MTALTGLGGLIRGAGDVAEVVSGNRAEEARQDHAEFIAALEQLSAEFSLPREGMFDRMVSALNRLPRPALALGTLGLFVYAMADPIGFAARMQGLDLVPEPLWWLLGAIVSFYFGARELHHFRRAGASEAAVVRRVLRARRQIEAERGLRDAPPAPTEPPVVTPVPRTVAAEAEAPDEEAANPALAEWRRMRSAGAGV